MVVIAAGLVLINDSGKYNILRTRRVLIMLRLRKIMIACVVCLLLLSGCCPEEEDDMSIPKGTPLYAMEVTIVGGFPNNIDLYKWINGLWVFIANPAHIGSIITQSFTDCIACNYDGIHCWWQNSTLVAASPSGWTYFPKIGVLSYWLLNPLPPTCKDYYLEMEIVDILGIVPSPTTIVFVWYCGPSAPQGLSPKVTGTTPV